MPPPWKLLRFGPLCRIWSTELPRACQALAPPTLSATLRLWIATQRRHCSLFAGHGPVVLLWQNSGAHLGIFGRGVVGAKALGVRLDGCAGLRARRRVESGRRLCGRQVAHQGPAVLGIALVAMAEDLGAAMAHRALEHLLQYGEPAARCGPPSPAGLGLGLMSVPRPFVLSSCTHLPGRTLLPCTRGE
jgi:hypothetical protein